MLSLAAALLVVASAGFIVYQNPPALPPLQDISLIMLFLLLATGQMAIIFHGLVFRQSLIPFGIKLNFREWYGTIHVALLWNYVLPFSGHGFRGHYLKKVYGLSYKRYAASLMLMYPAHIAIFSFWGLVALLVAYFESGYKNFILALIFFVLALSPCCVLLCAKMFEPFAQHEKVKDFIREGKRFVSDPGFALGFFLHTTMMYLFSSLFTVFAFASLNYALPTTAGFIIPSLANISALIKLAPASLGSLDVAFIYVGQTFGLGLSEGVVVAALTRLTHMVWFLPLGPLYSYILGKTMNSANSEAAA